MFPIPVRSGSTSERTHCAFNVASYAASEDDTAQTYVTFAEDETSGTSAAELPLPVEVFEALALHMWQSGEYAYLDLTDERVGQICDELSLTEDFIRAADEDEGVDDEDLSAYYTARAAEVLDFVLKTPPQQPARARVNQKIRLAL